MDLKNAEIEKVYKSLMNKKTGWEKMLMGFSMFAFSSSFLLHSLKGQTSSKKLKKSVFLRLYGADFNDCQKREIIKNL